VDFKPCPCCKQELSIASFGVRPDGRPRGYCRPCEAAKRKGHVASSVDAPKKKRAPRVRTLPVKVKEPEAPKPPKAPKPKPESKVCKDCLQDLQLSMFRPRSDGGCRTSCLLCEESRKVLEKLAKTVRTAQRREQVVKAVLSSGAKRCKVCAQTKTLREFRVNAQSLDGHEGSCSACRQAGARRVDPVDAERAARWLSRHATMERAVLQIKSGVRSDG